MRLPGRLISLVVAVILAMLCMGCGDDVESRRGVVDPYKEPVDSVRAA